MKMLILTTLFLLPNISSAAIQLAQVRNVYSTNNVTTSTWVQILGPTTGTITSLEIFDSSGQTLQIGVGVSVPQVQLLIFPGGNGMVNLNISSGSYIWLKAVSSTASTGELDINFYN